MSRSEPKVRRLSAMEAGTRGRVRSVLRDNRGRADRLEALGVSAGAPVTVLQRFPCVVFLCDQTELAVEPAVARAIIVQVD